MHSWVEGPGAGFSTEQMGTVDGDWHFELLGTEMFYHDCEDLRHKDMKDDLQHGVRCIKQAVLNGQEAFLEQVVGMLMLARAARVHMPKGSPLRHDLEQEIYWNGAREFGDKEEVCILSLLSGT